MGHEALAAISIQMQEDDYIVPFYRDRALVLGRGVSSRQLAIDYFAKAKGESHGRQMPSHYSCAEKHIWSVPTPTGSQLLPACGIAWGIKLDAKKAVVVATVGDAATRQGDFYEAICFAKEKKLPILFVVEDNGYGISSPTRKINPRALDVVQPNDWQELDGSNVGEMYGQAAKAFAHIRAGKGPVFFWVMMERLSSHTSSDDQKLYRSAEELKRLCGVRSAKEMERTVDRGRRDQRIRLRESGKRNQRADSPANLPTRKKKKTRQPTSSSSRSQENFRS